MSNSVGKNESPHNIKWIVSHRSLPAHFGIQGRKMGKKSQGKNWTDVFNCLQWNYEKWEKAFQRGRLKVGINVQNPFKLVRK